jgi:hypothetical protein
VLKKSIHLGFVWLLALCVCAQGIGAAAGGVLCFGCTNVWGGVGVVTQACESTENCCANVAHHSDDSAPCDDQDRHDQSHSQDCGCVDVTLAPHVATAAKPSFKIILPIVQHALVSLPLAMESQILTLHRPSTARAGPITVRLLSPCERRTVLVI